MLQFLMDENPEIPADEFHCLRLWTPCFNLTWILFGAFLERGVYLSLLLERSRFLELDLDSVLERDAALGLALVFLFFDEAPPEEAAPEELAAFEAKFMRDVSPSIIVACVSTSVGAAALLVGARFAGGADSFGLAIRLAVALFKLAISPDTA